MDEPKRLVRDGYDRIARDYETWGEHFGVRRKYLAQLRAAVPIGERVVDLGCGTGRHATAALADQYRVVGVDISPVSAALAQQAVPTAQFVVGDMTDVSVSTGCVRRRDGVLLVDPRSSRPTAGRPPPRRGPGSSREGYSSSRWGSSTSEKSIGSFLGTPMYWSSWSRAENVRLVEQAGYRVSSATDETELENGTPVTHLWVVATRRDCRRGCPERALRRC